MVVAEDAVLIQLRLTPECRRFRTPLEKMSRLLRLQSPRRLDRIMALLVRAVDMDPVAAAWLVAKDAELVAEWAGEWEWELVPLPGRITFRLPLKEMMIERIQSHENSHNNNRNNNEQPHGPKVRSGTEIYYLGY